MKLIALVLTTLALAACGATLDANKIKPIKPWAAEVEKCDMRGTIIR